MSSLCSVCLGDDLESVSNRVYDKMAQLDSSGGSAGVVDMLLGMHLLEDELVGEMYKFDALMPVV